MFPARGIPPFHWEPTSRLRKGTEGNKKHKSGLGTWDAVRGQQSGGLLQDWTHIHIGGNEEGRKERLIRIEVAVVPFSIPASFLPLSSAHQGEMGGDRSRWGVTRKWESVPQTDRRTDGQTQLLSID